MIVIGEFGSSKYTNEDASAATRYSNSSAVPFARSFVNQTSSIQQPLSSPIQQNINPENNVHSIAGDHGSSSNVSNSLPAASPTLFSNEMSKGNQSNRSSEISANVSNTHNPPSKEVEVFNTTQISTGKPSLTSTREPVTSISFAAGTLQSSNNNVIDNKFTPKDVPSTSSSPSFGNNTAFKEASPSTDNIKTSTSVATASSLLVGTSITSHAVSSTDSSENFSKPITLQKPVSISKPTVDIQYLEQPIPYTSDSSTTSVGKLFPPIENSTQSVSTKSTAAKPSTSTNSAIVGSSGTEPVKALVSSSIDTGSKETHMGNDKEFIDSGQMSDSESTTAAPIMKEHPPEQKNQVNIHRNTNADMKVLMSKADGGNISDSVITTVSNQSPPHIHDSNRNPIAAQGPAIFSDHPSVNEEKTTDEMLFADRRPSTGPSNNGKAQRPKLEGILSKKSPPITQRSLSITAGGFRSNNLPDERKNSPKQKLTTLPNSVQGNARSKARSVKSREDDMRPVVRYLNAASEGNLDAVKSILENELRTELVDVTDEYDDKKQTALMNACMNAHFDVVEYLLSQGASLQQRNSIGGHATFFAAGAIGGLPCLKLCLEKGGDITESTILLRTPLWFSAFFGASENMAYIIGLPNIDLNKPNINGFTPLMIATINGHADCVELLIKAGADLNAKTPIGWTAVAIAKSLHRNDCLHLLYAAHVIDMDPPQFPMDNRFLQGVKLNEYQDVDEMKIQTMYKMVEECRIIIHGKEVTKKVLYLTNKQAVMFDELAMERVVQALDIGEPKFVIQLLPSMGSAKQMLLAHSERIGSKEVEYEQSTSASSEISADDERVVETQLLLFMKNCVLPLAVQTKALILVGGANDCILSASLSKVALAEQARLGKDCPFTVLATVAEREIHANAIAAGKPSLVAAQIARQSIAWQKRLEYMNEFYGRTMLKKVLDPNAKTSDSMLQQCDLTEAAERYIIFEGFEEGLSETEEGHINGGPQKAFESVFLQYMTKKLPSIAIQCFNANRGFQFLVDLTTRNIPVLLLDTSERCISSMKYDQVLGPATKMAKISDAFPCITLEQFHKMQIEDGRLSDEGMEVLLNIAFEMIERKINVLVNEGVIDNLNTSLMAFFHHALTVGSSIGVIDGHSVIPLYERIRETEKFERTNKDMKKTLVSPELVTRVLDFIYSRVAACNVQCQLSRVDKWLQKHDKKYHYMLSDAVVYKKALEKAVETIDNNGGLMTGYNFDSSVWMAQYDLLMSANTFSGSVFDLDEIKRVLGSVAKIDRLPNANSLEALRTLQDAWDHVEVYHFMADRYKMIGKLTYIAMLLTGIAITVMSQIASIMVLDLRFVIIALSFLGSILAAYVAYTNPIVKWQQLRVAALSMESNIWMFRTRAGPYRTTGEDFDQSSEQLLGDVLRHIKTSVLESADVKSTSFFSHTSSYNKHGQHAPNHPTFGAIDSFVSPKTKHTKKHSPTESRTQSRLSRPSETDDGMSKKDSTTPKSSPVKEKAETDRSPRMERIYSDDSSLSYSKLTDLRLPTFSIKERPDREEEEEDEEGSEPDAPRTVALDVKKLRLSSNGIRLCDILSTFRKQEDDSVRQLSQDSHYQPVQPDNFIRFRIMPVLKYYRKKIPDYSKWRAITHTLLVVGSIASAILAIARLGVWAAIVSVSTISITAYQEFSGANSKLSRYSYTVHELQELIFWW